MLLDTKWCTRKRASQWAWREMIRYAVESAETLPAIHSKSSSIFLPHKASRFISCANKRMIHSIWISISHPAQIAPNGAREDGKKKILKFNLLPALFVINGSMFLYFRSAENEKLCEAFDRCCFYCAFTRGAVELLTLEYELFKKHSMHKELFSFQSKN